MELMPKRKAPIAVCGIKCVCTSFASCQQAVTRIQLIQIHCKMLGNNDALSKFRKTIGINASNFKIQTGIK